MEITIFLAKMWGPVVLAIGFGVAMNRKYYISIYRDLDKGPLAMLMFSMLAIAGGIVQISFHNVWSTFPEIVVSFLGWALLFKGLMFAIAPNFVDKAGEWEVKSHLIPISYSLMLIVGAYLSYIGYLA